MLPRHEESSPVSDGIKSRARARAGPGCSPPSVCWWLWRELCFLLFRFVPLSFTEAQAERFLCFIALLTTTPCGGSAVVPVLHVRNLSFRAWGRGSARYLTSGRSGFESRPFSLRSPCSDPQSFFLRPALRELPGASNVTCPELNSIPSASNLLLPPCTPSSEAGPPPARLCQCPGLSPLLTVPSLLSGPPSDVSPACPFPSSATASAVLQATEPHRGTERASPPTSLSPVSPHQAFSHHCKQI